MATLKRASTLAAGGAPVARSAARKRSTAAREAA